MSCAPDRKRSKMFLYEWWGPRRPSSVWSGFDPRHPLGPVEEYSPPPLRLRKARLSVLHPHLRTLVRILDGPGGGPGLVRRRSEPAARCRTAVSRDPGVRDPLLAACADPGGEHGRVARLEKVVGLSDPQPLP